MSYSSILEAIKSASEVTPDKICLGDKKNKVTYKQFWKMINKGASFLEENGVKKGDVVSDYSFSTHGYSYSEGLNSNLSGIQALWFARERHAFAEGDKQRGRDQMKVIEAVIKKAQSSALLNNYDEIFANISKSFQTNMPKKDIKALVKYQLNETPNWKVVSTSVTGTGRSDVTYSVPNSRAYVMDPDENSVSYYRRFRITKK